MQVGPDVGLLAEEYPRQPFEEGFTAQSIQRGGGIEDGGGLFRLFGCGHGRFPLFPAGGWEQAGHGGGQLVGLYGLEQPAVDPHAAECLLVTGVQRGGQHEDRGFRRDAEFPGTDLPRDVEPGHVREAHVQQYGVGLQLADEV